MLAPYRLGDAPVADVMAHAFAREAPELEAEDGRVSMAERHRLAALEGVISANLHGFVAAGEALFEIRERRLYRNGYASFGAYCEQRWGLSRSRAHRLMEAAQTARLLPMGNGAGLPHAKINERIVRELTALRKSHPDLVSKTYETVLKSTPRATHREMRKAATAVLRNGGSPGNLVQTIRAAIAAAEETVVADGRAAQRKAAQEFLEVMRAVCTLPPPSDLMPWLTAGERADVERMWERAAAWCGLLAAHPSRSG